jgi:hypothetical protein
MTRGVAQVVKYLPDKNKTLSSNPSTTKKKKKEREGDKGFILAHSGYQLTPNCFAPVVQKNILQKAYSKANLLNSWPRSEKRRKRKRLGTHCSLPGHTFNDLKFPLNSTS